MTQGLPLAGIILSICGSSFAQLQPPSPTKPAPALAASSAPQRAPVTLKVGDQAPALTVDTWVKGEPVPSFQRGKVYVIEFFATWCLPCKASIPQMTQMQRTHADLTLICIAGSEHTKKGEPDTRLTKLSDFVKSQGAAMGYRVAYDSTPTMSQSWLQAAGVRGIPSGFIVDGEGRIACIGHPLDKSFQQALNDALAKAAVITAQALTTKRISATDGAAKPATPAVGAPDAAREQGSASAPSTTPAPAFTR